MRKILLPAVILIASVLVTTQATAFHSFGGPIMGAINQLDLSNSQRSQIRQILQSHRGEGRQELEKMRGPIENFIALDPTSATYDSDVKALSTQAADDSRQRTAKFAELQRQIFPILTAAQRDKLPDLIENTPLKGRMPQFGGHFEDALDELNLSDAQWLSIHKIMEAQKANRAQGATAMRQLIADFATLDPSSSSYATDLQSISDRFAQNAASHVIQFGDLKKQVYAVLTPAQRSQLTSELQQRLAEFQPGNRAGEQHGNGPDSL